MRIVVKGSTPTILEPGSTAVRGRQGMSAYEVAVKDGFVGSEEEWLASLVGPKGETGDTGSVGPQGPQGPKGDTGDTGRSGRIWFTEVPPAQTQQGYHFEYDDLYGSDIGVPAQPGDAIYLVGDGYLYQIKRVVDYGISDIYAYEPDYIRGPQGPKGDTGATGPAGANGTTFTPAVSSAGVLSWTNDGGKANPTPVSIKGPQGDPAMPSAYAASQSAAGPADKAVSIPFGEVDGTSTATAFTATISGITELRHGVCVMLKNGVVTSAAGCTLNINGLGAKPIYQTMAASTAVTTTFNINYTMLFFYNSTRVTGGCWDMYYGYNANTTYTNASLGQGYATCTTAAATVAKTASLSSYALTAGGVVAVKFSNDVPASATLNVNSKGAKAIYYKGAAIQAGVIKAGDVATFIYSTYYHLISIDRWGSDINDLAARLDALVDADEEEY